MAGKYPKRRLPFSTLGPELDKLTRKAFSKFGFADGQVLSRWPEIVGPQLARLTAPEKLSRQGSGKQPGATLTVRVAGAAALEMQHLTPQILERINRFYGREAVTRLRLVQGPLPPPSERPGARPKRPSLPPVSPEDARAAEDARSHISDPALGDALARLGKAVLATRRQAR